MKKTFWSGSFLFTSFLFFFLLSFSSSAGSGAVQKNVVSGIKKSGEDLVSAGGKNLPAGKKIQPAGEKKLLPKGEKKDLPKGEKKDENRRSIPPSMQKFVRELSLVLTSLQKNSPHSAKKLAATLEKESLENLRLLLENNESGIKCILTVPGQKKLIVKKTPEQKRTVFFSENLYDQKIFYIVLPDLSKESFEKFTASLKEKNRQCKGVILDLRKCSSYKGDPELFIRSIPKISSPVFSCLIGPETCGDGEIFAHAISKISGSILIGSPTKGQPFVLRTLPLKLAHAVPGKNGKFALKKLMYILVPVIPEKWKEIPPVKVKPRIRTKITPLYVKGTLSPDQDPALRIGADLLLSLDIVK